jgi:hypothetical protein
MESSAHAVDKQLMTPNDAQMDVLLRRYAKGAAEAKNVEHLDADELNAFAEGALPPAARSRYVSHLADCDDCRKLASQLAIAAGRVEEVRVPASESTTEQPWWRKISTVFAPPVLRYVAFAVVLVAVVGIAFVVWRRPRPAAPDLIAQNQPAAQTGEAVKPSQTHEPANAGEAQREGTIAKAVPQPTAAPFSDQKKLESSEANSPPPPKPADALAAKETAPATTAGSTSGLPRSEASPSYAPAPPTESERADIRSRGQQNVGGLLAGGSTRNESSEKYKVMDRSRSGEPAKDRDEDRARAANQPAATENKQEDAPARGRTESRTAPVPSRSVQEMRIENRKADKTEETETEMRSVGGRKFKRQGNAWVDVKLKTSMAIRTISRDSEDFEKLDSGLRSIVHQLSGQIIVVWKGKAYRIQ